jgi:hypothetical protein
LDTPCFPSGLVAGSGLALLLPRLDSPLGHHGAVLEAVRLVPGLHDVAVVGKPVKQRSCHFGVIKHGRPFREAQVGRDDDPGVFVQLRQQVEQQGTAGLAEG